MDERMNEPVYKGRTAADDLRDLVDQDNEKSLTERASALADTRRVVLWHRACWGGRWCLVLPWGKLRFRSLSAARRLQRYRRRIGSTRGTVRRWDRRDRP
jgi:hypothetical protein